MQRPILRSLLLFSAAAGATLLATSDLSGLLRSANPPLDRASAPYNNYANCTACHTSFDLNSGTGSVSISGAPAEYTPGATYTLTVTNQRTGASRWGYELTALDGSGDQIGTLQNPDANSQIRTSSSRDFASHQLGGTFQGTADGPVAWTVDWVAPAAGAGTAHFYASGNTANNNGANGGDRIYNYAAASAEAGAAHPDGTIIAQLQFPDPTGSSDDFSRAVDNDRLKAKIRVTNHLGTTETFAVATQVRLPNGNLFPSTGFITTNQLTLAPGETGTVHFDKPIKNTAPLGSYEFRALTGFAPSTLVDTDVVNFEVVP